MRDTGAWFYQGAWDGPRLCRASPNPTVPYRGILRKQRWWLCLRARWKHFLKRGDQGRMLQSCAFGSAGVLGAGWKNAESAKELKLDCRSGATGKRVTLCGRWSQGTFYDLFFTEKNKPYRKQNIWIKSWKDKFAKEGQHQKYLQ